MKKLSLLIVCMATIQLSIAQINTTVVGGSYVEETKNYGFACNGKLIAIGSTGAGAYVGSSFKKRAGIVKLYLKTSEGWKNEKTFSSVNPISGYGFGSGIAMNNDFLFVAQTRSLYVYKIGDLDTNITLVQTIDILTAYSLALNKDKLIYRKSNGKYAVSKLINDKWTEVQELDVSSDVNAKCYNVVCKEDWLFLGMPEYELDKTGANQIPEAGIVFAYKLNASDEYELHSIIEPKVRKENTTWGYGEFFGWSVDYESGWLAVSAQQADGNSGRKQGGVYLFKLENDVWVEKQKLGSSSDFFLEQFGTGVTFVDGNLLIGNKNENPAEGSPIIYQFYRNGNSFDYKIKGNGGAQKLIMLGDTFLSTYSNDEDVYMYEGTFTKETVSINPIIDSKQYELDVAYSPQEHALYINSKTTENDDDINIYNINGQKLLTVSGSAVKENSRILLPSNLKNQMIVVQKGNEFCKIVL